VVRDRFGPKAQGRDIVWKHPNFPSPGKSPPNLAGGRLSDEPAAFTANYEEVGHVPDGLVSREVGSFLYEGETGDPAIDSDDERESIRLRPIKRQGAVFESSIRAEGQGQELREVVLI
jgi:hypothetical protein